LKNKTANITTLALTMGDPAGIGPEIALKALSNTAALPQNCRIMIIGDLEVLQNTAGLAGVKSLIRAMKSETDTEPLAINILDMHTVSPLDFKIGIASALCGKAAFAYICKGIEMAMAGTINGIVTNPINKLALSLAGINYPGHTEILAEKTKTTDYSMVFMLDNISVAHVTTHCSLKQAISLINEDRVHSTIQLLNTTLIANKIKSPRIAVGGLNPHAGENGLFGSEEEVHISPAVKKAKALGINVSGPFPPDTVFSRAFKGEFDGVVSMLHDHGFVALKSRDFENGVNVTIGLPIIRTSVGHGTGFDIAGKGTASEKSLVNAIRVAARMAQSGVIGRHGYQY
jgi:4-hydroxythreonine-4-phosphate dehydrogenase